MFSTAAASSPAAEPTLLDHCESLAAAALPPRTAEARARVAELRYGEARAVRSADVDLLMHNLFADYGAAALARLEALSGLKVIAKHGMANRQVRELLDEAHVVPILAHLAIFAEDPYVRQLAASAFLHPVSQRSGQHLELQHNSACESQWSPGHYFQERYIPPLAHGLLPDGAPFDVFEFYRAVLDGADPELQARGVEALHGAQRVRVGSIDGQSAAQSELQPILRLAYHHPHPETRALAVELFGFAELPRNPVNGRFLPHAVRTLNAINLTLSALIRRESEPVVLRSAGRMLDAMSWREADLEEALEAYEGRGYLPGLDFERPNSNERITAVDLCAILQERLMQLQRRAAAPQAPQELACSYGECSDERLLTSVD